MKKSKLLFMVLSFIAGLFCSLTILALSVGPAAANGTAGASQGSNSPNDVQRFPRWIWTQLDPANSNASNDYFVFDGNYVIDESHVIGSDYNILDTFVSPMLTPVSTISVYDENHKPVCKLIYYYQSTNSNPNASDIHYRVDNINSSNACQVTRVFYEPQSPRNDITYYLNLSVN